MDGLSNSLDDWRSAVRIGGYWITDYISCRYMQSVELGSVLPPTLG
jgi:hypothetical protein